MNAAAAPPPLPPPPRSTLVTVTAWIAGGMCALGLLLLAVQVGGYALMSGTPTFSEAMRQLRADPQTAPLIASAARWLPWLLLASLLKCSVGVVASIGLLKRREWGRRLFVALLVVAALWQCVAIPMQHTFTTSIRGVVLKKLLGAMSGPQAQQVRTQFETSMNSSQVTTVVIGIAFIGLYAWLAWTLCTPRVRREFAVPDAAHGTVAL